jgi:N-acylneuraminate cytidylyltransferase
MEILGIVGARSGSKGLPGKNVRLLRGRPLLAHAIGIARQCSLVSRVILSTDSEEYAAIGRDAGAETPFLRPAEHATDTSIDLAFISHALEWLDENEGYRPDMVVRFCPTAPLIRPSDVEACIELLMGDPAADSSIIVSPAREHPRKAVKIAADGVHAISYMTDRGVDVAPSNRHSYAAAFNRQALPVVSRRETILTHRSQTGDVIRFHLVPAETALDIDTDADFRLVEAMMASQEQ